MQGLIPALNKKIWDNQTNPDEFSLSFTLSQLNDQIFWDTAQLAWFPWSESYVALWKQDTAVE